MIVVNPHTFGEKMKIEELFDLTEEESEKYQFTSWLIEKIKELYSLEYFCNRKEFLKELNKYLLDFSLFMCDDYIKGVMLGDYVFPLPNIYEFTEEEFDKIHKRYKKLKKMNRLSKE